MDKIVKSHEEYDGLKEKELRKEKLKRVLKKASVAVSVGAAGFIGYKFGVRTGNLNTGLFVHKVLEDHPDLKEPFMDAVTDTISKLEG